MTDKKKKPGTGAKTKKGVNYFVANPGRPTAYRVTMLPLVRKLVSLGATDSDIAEALQVDMATLYRWKHKHKAFCDTLKEWKQYADETVVRRLYERAVGYTAQEDKVFQNGGDVIVVKTLKHYPPDVAAAFIWLKNRKPDTWRDRRDDAPTASAEEMADKIRGLVQSIDDGVPLALPPNGGGKA